jgi:protein-S-isoprenylcysteine O-methyltransferase Ste14
MIALCIALGAMLHTLLVFAPSLATGEAGRLAADPRFGVLLVAVNLFYAFELLAIKHAAPRPIRALSEADRRLHRLSRASCASIVLVFWCAQLQAIGTTASALILTAGAVVLAAGLLLRGFAIVQLRGQFISEATRPGQSALLQTGIYAWLRHPSEAGLILIVAGAALSMHSYLAGLLIAVVVLPLTIARIRLEEIGLKIAFGQEFADYCARVPPLAPLKYCLKTSPGRCSSALCDS